MARKQCRIWWPRQLLLCKPSFNMLLFGWYIHSSDSFDIVLAFATSTLEISVNLIHKDLQELLRHVDAKMPLTLQKSSTFSVLGICILESNVQNMKNATNQYIDSYSKRKRGKMLCLEADDNTSSSSILNGCVHNRPGQNSFLCESVAEDCGICRCGCVKLDPSIDTQRQVLIRSGNWIQLFFRMKGSTFKGTRWIPEFDHIHQNGDVLPIKDFHLIMYDLPAYGRHHYALNFWTNHHNQKAPIPDLEAVVSALNCSDAAKQLLQQRIFVGVPISQSLLCWMASKLWSMLAILLSTISSVVYITFQLFYMVLGFSFCKLSTMIIQKTFKHTWKNLQIRICQFLFWPVFLLSSFSSHSNAEFAHINALRKHHMWSSVAVDLLLGAVYGLNILANADFICFWINFVSRDITDNLLRSGCVWLMGVPAGFKLNTELAELFGMISLDAIQTFSTLGLFIGSFLQHFIRGLAFSGILFGLTVPAALCIDMLKLMTLHVTALHWLISFVYSQQIQALVSLWRLFRGRKWNPLRERLDSYDDYSVGQHVVGSLLFTPLLLLLPTTSVFYIFFTLLRTSLILICLLIEMTISVLHATPYAELFLWLVRRRRFPSGIWFEIIPDTLIHSSPSHGFQAAGHMASNLRSSNGLQETIVSILHSNYATLGQIMFPCYVRVFRMVSPNFSKQLASGILSGRRMPSCLDTDLPPTMPWMQLSFKQYWRLCYCSIVSCNL